MRHGHERLGPKAVAEGVEVGEAMAVAAVAVDTAEAVVEAVTAEGTAVRARR